MPVPLLYKISRIFIRIGVNSYFRKLEISGRQNIPSSGPIIFASNHPHSITDALLLGLSTGRMLHFIAHSGLFRSKYKAWFLKNSGVIPVYRPKDVGGAPDNNSAMFAACHNVLRHGESIGIFPEGTSAEERRVQKIKTGTARIALSAEQDSHWKMGLTIIPVGLNFESRQHFRSRVLIRFGHPIVVANLRDQYLADEKGTVLDLTLKLQNSLRKEVVNVEQTEFDKLLRDVGKIYKNELIDRIDLEIPGATHFEQEQGLDREFARALAFFYERSPEMIWGLAKRMEQYQKLRHRLRLRDELLRKEEGPSVRAEMVRFLMMGAIGLPLAIYGALGNALPYLLTGHLVHLMNVDLTKRHSFQFLIGLILFLAWYWVLLMRAMPVIGLWFTLALFCTLPLTGLFARQYILRMKRRRRWLRFAWMELKLGYKIRELRQMRRQIIRELDASLAEYLQALKDEL